VPSASSRQGVSTKGFDQAQFRRVWAMPNGETFSVPPIGEFVRRYLVDGAVSVDPFARNRDWCTYTNDLDPLTSAQSHMDAEEFCLALGERGVVADVAIFDPPYSPRQIADCYRRVGLAVGQQETQSGLLYRRVRDALDRLVPIGGIVLSFGWQSTGMGRGRGYTPLEYLLVAHGGAHNDTICVAERKIASVDTHPKGGDSEAAPALLSGAVGEAETPKTSPARGKKNG
jgi:hypothetical protein